MLANSGREKLCKEKMYYICFVLRNIFFHKYFSLTYILTFTFTKLRHLRQPITCVAGDVMFYFCRHTHGNKVEALLHVYQKVVHLIIAANALASSRILTHRNTASFSIKTVLP